MRRRTLVLMAMLATSALPSLYGQGPEPGATASIRVAAVRFALANGLEFPSGELVVAREMGFQRTVPPSKLLSTELESQATAISRAIGHGARPGSAAQLLVCRRIACVPTTDASVLLVDEPTKKEPSVISVFIRIYEPSTNVAEYDASLSQGIVQVEQHDGLWVGVRFELGPSKTKIKLPR